MLETKQLTLNEILAPIKEDLGTLDSRLLYEISPASRSLNSILQNVFQNCGKRIRPSLSFLFAKLLKDEISQEEQEKIFLIAEISELIHTASLVHDDIIDNSMIRRGQPTTNSTWNNAITVISGDFMFARAAVNLGKVGINAVTSIYASVLEDLCDGEIWQAEKKFDLEVDYDFYLNKTYKKTASLFQASCQAVAVALNTSSQEIIAAANFGKNLGMAFQIVDDILDYTQEASTLGKPALADLKEGHMTLPILLCLEDLEKNSAEDFTKAKSLIDSIKTNPEQADEYLAEIKTYIESQNSIEKSFDYASKFAANAKEAIANFDDSDVKNSLLGLLDYTSQRKY